MLVADVGAAGGPAEWGIDGYATLFAEGAHDRVLVPVGVGSLTAAGAPQGARAGTRVLLIGSEGHTGTGPSRGG
ncbi:hypothetical protein FSW04_07525 [Baekduia soli]|uniref:Uncharacterized protein n=1 Tax=Baekduia soli TaxID=496014 RepID=A0A5B8U397_9ACTN|nr:hypothetical protein [Baekduia soli]QEC47443.1 hypothetical protein FSW04_07525 [Baekduia soli]